MIHPEPHFVVKTKTDKGEKLLINILSHEKIDMPRMIKKLDENGEEVEGLNIPLSISDQFRLKRKRVE